jgi:hypothetical protein
MKTTTEEISDMPYRPDSVTIGTPAKGGEMKVYYDASNLDQAKILVENAVELLAHARAKYDAAGLPKPSASPSAAP